VCVCVFRNAPSAKASACTQDKNKTAWARFTRFICASASASHFYVLGLAFGGKSPTAKEHLPHTQQIASACKNCWHSTDGIRSCLRFYSYQMIGVACCGSGIIGCFLELWKNVSVKRINVLSGPCLFSYCHQIKLGTKIDYFICVQNKQTIVLSIIHYLYF
jgi:hypothetical protein